MSDSNYQRMYDLKTFDGDEIKVTKENMSQLAASLNMVTIKDAKTGEVYYLNPKSISGASLETPPWMQ